MISERRLSQAHNYQMWVEMIHSDQMSHRQVIDFLEDHPIFAIWYKKIQVTS